MADKPGQKPQDERSPVKGAPAAKAPAAQPAKAEAKPVETKPAETKPAETKPVQTKPAAEAPKPASSPAPAPTAEVQPPAAATAKNAAPADAGTPPKLENTAPPPVDELKDKIMATTNTDFTQPINEALGDLQARARAAYDKGTEVATEVTDFTKGNVEAIVESSKILATGAQSLGKTYAEEAKSAYETITSDVKELAAIRTPAELFQLQGKIMRRNFDTFVATTSRNSEAVLKLANDTFAPFTGRVTVAAEKFSKVA